MSVIDEHDLALDDEQHEQEPAHAPLRAPTPTTLDEGRGVNPFLIFGSIAIVAIVLIAIVAFYIHARLTAPPGAPTRSTGAQTSPLDGGTTGTVGAVPAWALPSVKASATPFPTRQACTPGTTPEMTMQGMVCRRRLLFGPAAAGGAQAGANGALPCGTGTVDTVVQTATGPQHECVIAARPSYPPQQQAQAPYPRQTYSTGGTQTNYPYQQPPRPAAPAPRPSPTLAGDHIAFASPPPRVTSDEQQAQYDVAAQYGPGSSYSYNGSQNANDPPGTPAPDPPAQQQSGEFANAPHYVRPQTYAQINAGSVITVRLRSKIVSDLGGPCLFQIQGDLFDSHTHNIVVVPNGAQGVCEVNPQVNFGVGRVAISLQTLTFPDGREFYVGGLDGSDGMGSSGIAGDVNNHLGAVRGAAGYLILATALESALTAHNQVNPFGQPSIGSQIASAAGGTLSQITNETIRQRLQQRPTVTVNPGTTVQFIVTRDLPLVPYYQQEPQ